MYKAAQAAERAAYEQYQMAVDGAQSEDRASARSLVEAARSTVDEVSSLLVDSRLTAPEDGQIATIFPKRGELVAPGTPIMSLVVMDDAHVVLNIREDLMPQFKMGGTFRADVPPSTARTLNSASITSVRWAASPPGNPPNRRAAMTCRRSRYTHVPHSR